VRRAAGLFEPAFSYHALHAAATRAWRGRKHRRGAEALAFMVDLDPSLWALQRALLSGAWRPGAPREFMIHDPKPRLICAAPFADRVVHHALCAALAPRLEAALPPQSFACRPGYGLHRALAAALRVARACPFVLRLDVAHYFESIPHDLLLAQVRRLYKEPPLLRLIERVVREGHPRGAGGRGLPIGALTSQHLANLYLAPVDRLALTLVSARGYVRYMDDLVLGFETAEAAWRAHALLAARLGELGLRLKPSETRLSGRGGGWSFLGFRLWPHRVRLDAPRRRRLIRRVRALSRAAASGRLAGDALRRRVEGVSAWVAAGHTRALRVSVWGRRWEVWEGL